VEAATVDLNVPDEELAQRDGSAGRFGTRIETGWLNVYQRTVGPVHEGAVLTPPTATSREQART
jgi:dihydroxy-acid dehydratase